MAEAIGWLWNVLKAGFTWLVESLFGLLVWAWTWFRDWNWEALLDAREVVVAYLDSAVSDALLLVFKPPVVSAMVSVSWILPVYESIAMIAATFGLVASVRLIRWAVGLIPGVNG